MVQNLASIPHELFREVVSLLLLPDQAALARTCKALNHLLTPVVWSEIELHHSGTHEGIDIEGEISDFTSGDSAKRMARELADDPAYPYKQLIFGPSERKYSECSFNPPRWKHSYERRTDRRYTVPKSRAASFSGNNNQFTREEKLMRVRKLVSEERWSQLAQHVRSLCMSIGVDAEVMDMISSLKSLRSLEVVGLCKREAHAPTAPDAELPELENLKLRGYFSAAWVRKICNNAARIKYLDLGILATPTDDAAYEETLFANKSSVPITEKQAEHYQRNGAEATAMSTQLDRAESASQETDSGVDGAGSDDEEFDDDELPLVMHGAIWLPRSLPSKLTALTHLHLVKPYTGETARDAHDSFRQIPHQYEQVLCMEWRFLLEGVGATLKELILEHRIPIDIGDSVGDGDPFPEYKGSRRQLQNENLSSAPDRGDVLFCRSILRLLLEQSNRFSKLQHLALRGIQIKGIPTRRASGDRPGKHGALDNDELLRKTYPDCDVEFFEDAYTIHVDSEYYGNLEIGAGAVQDEGDGLLWSLWFYNDYKKRFGPQWKILD
ncbi:uncharacterized protein JN550_005873 [Neoarthrinium moseri]|uniref:uncharacterized protein n=1 Tax=Neoarthrinium moseri TaxID=1658444 RepID=UPI001FDD3B57|nr:uncharacterized protein JN550_005873 [Neoarthrinium moseri]KAI1869243.1 hypothetical protein JN550_005873 [Neoarthrinium moseri]